MHFVNLHLNSFQHVTTRGEKLGELEILKSEPDGSFVVLDQFALGYGSVIFSENY